MPAHHFHVSSYKLSLGMVFLVVVLLAVVLQHQQTETKELVYQACLQRQSTTVSINQTWETLADTLNRDYQIRADTRTQLVATLRQAKQPVPTCAY
jgi:hypothetical protein